MLQDIAVLTGGLVISEELGLKLENIAIKQLGRASRVVIDKDSTKIIGGAGHRAEIQGRIEQIKREIENTTSDYDREKLQERLAKLSGGVAVVRVGAPSEAEMKSRKEALDDAISATKAAVAEGVRNASPTLRNPLPHWGGKDEEGGGRGTQAIEISVPIPQAASARPESCAMRPPQGSVFSTRTRRAIAAIQSGFMRPPAKSSAISIQQQPRQ